MWSGKSTMAIMAYWNAKAGGDNPVLVKPRLDNRYSPTNFIVTHDGNHQPACVLDSLQEGYDQLRRHNVIIIDECQFFDDLRWLVDQFSTKADVTIRMHGLLNHVNEGTGSVAPFMAVLQVLTM